jgi:hypothetical protein
VSSEELKRLHDLAAWLGIETMDQFRTAWATLRKAEAVVPGY